MRRLLKMLLVVLTPAVAMANGYKVGDGDTIGVHVFGEETLTRAYRVDERCTIEVGLIGKVDVCGRTTAAIADDVTSRLGAGYLVNPHVSVDIDTYGSRTVLVTGAVKNEMQIALDGPTTVLQAIVKAGGKKESNVREVRVVSADGSMITYDYAELASGVPTFVHAGDTVIMSEGQLVWVSGEVKQEGPVTYREGLTVTQALAMSGGPNEFARVRRAYVVRPDGQKVVVNMPRILGGRDADLMLGPDDKLVIP